VTTLRALRSHPRAPVVAVVALIGIAAGGRIWLTRGVQAPQILCDEFIYAELAKNFAATGHFGVRGERGYANLLYPFSISPAYVVTHSMATTYGLIKAINAVVMSLTALPVYLWARRLVSAWWAVIAAALVLVLPAFVFTGMVMSENAALPTIVFALFALALVLERPTFHRQLLLFAAAAVAYLARTQNLVLGAIAPTAVALKMLFDARAGIRRHDLVRELRLYWPSASLFVIAVGIYVERHSLAHVPLASTLAAYSGVGSAHYSAMAVARWALRHAAEAELVVGVAPLAALVVLTALAVGGKIRDHATRSFVAVAVCAFVWLLLEVGLFADAFAPWITERYSFYVEPLLLLALIVWIGRGLPRPQIGTTVAILFCLALLQALPLAKFVVNASAYNVVALYSLYKLDVHLPGGTGVLGATLTAGAIVALLVLALAPRAVATIALPAAVGLTLVLASKPVLGNVKGLSSGWSQATGPERSWIDQRLGTHRATTAVLYTPKPTVWESSSVLMQTEFWNRSVGPVYNLGRTELCPLPEKSAHVDLGSGEIVLGTGQVLDRKDAPGLRYVLTDQGLPLAAAAVENGGSPTKPFTIYRLGGPMRLPTTSDGIYTDGWMGGRARYTQYWSPTHRGGTAVVGVSRVGWGGPDVPGHVTIRIVRLVRHSGHEQLKRGSTVAVRHLFLHRLETHSISLPAPAPPFAVLIHVTPTFSPSNFGQPDTRQLGAQVSFSFSPGPAGSAGGA
jgi:Dolichyl-phosphate-mannose-protein mannosyltransferase